MTELILGAIVAAISAFVGGKLWGSKKYKDGYTEGRVDQVDEYDRASEAAQGAIDAVAKVAGEERVRAHQRADREAEKLLGRKPTRQELHDFFNDN